jgi:predicted signal transduction protein with EAL and GGDEF domain/FixJ family two-component response regulator
MDALERPPMKILVVDDEPTARMLMRAALRKAGYAVVLAECGLDALRQFRAGGCDMVMLDVDMPDLSGHQVCAALRAEAGELLPIVMVTGMDDVRSVEQAYESGATDFIPKPINWALIGHRVRYLFRADAAQRDLRAANARNAAMLNAMPDTLLRMSPSGRVLEARMAGGSADAGPADGDRSTLAQRYPAETAQRLIEKMRLAREQGVNQLLEFSVADPAGQPRYYEARVAMIDGDEALGLVRDITERKEAQSQIEQLAYFDSLTGLPNRRAFLDRLGREVRRAEHGQRKLGVLFLNLDGFKQVNDTLGHTVGDTILLRAADRLRQTMRPSDLVSRVGEPAPEGEGEGEGEGESEGEVELARLGGDEFTVLVPGIARAQDALKVARRISEVMRWPFPLEGRELALTSSIGIAVYPDDGADAETLLKHADTAMHHAKHSGRGHCQLYSAQLTEHAMQRMELDSSLRLALAAGEFHLVYQPKLDLASGRVRSVEALIRWTHPTRGLISPLDFIPLAEENGLIVAIGQWVLRTACADAARWQLPGAPVGVAVNLSPMQFKDPLLVQSVLDVLAQTPLEPELLELEVTESAVMENSVATIGTLHALRDSGARIALDDFGTGYSSLSYLTRMPIGNLKIDRSFVSGLQDGGHNESIIRAIVAMAASLGMGVTAEGVETIEQARILKGMACDTLQGYYFSRPVPAAEIPALLARSWRLDDPGPAHSRPAARGAAPVAAVAVNQS